MTGFFCDTGAIYGHINRCDPYYGGMKKITDVHSVYSGSYYTCETAKNECKGLLKRDKEKMKNSTFRAIRRDLERIITNHIKVVNYSGEGAFNIVESSLSRVIDGDNDCNIVAQGIFWHYSNKDYTNYIFITVDNKHIAKQKDKIKRIAEAILLDSYGPYSLKCIMLQSRNRAN